MGNAALENSARRELLVSVNGVVVAGHAREQDDVGFRDGLGKDRGHPNAKLIEFIATELIHRTILLNHMEPERHFVGCCRRLL